MRQLTSVVMSGVLDRFPKLRIAFLEAGVGWIPYLIERMDRAFEVRAMIDAGAAEAPDEDVIERREEPGAG